MKRSAAITIVAIGLLGVIAFVRWRTPAVTTPLDRKEFAAYASCTEKEAGWAPVQLWWEAPPEVKGQWRAKKAARISLMGGEVFIGDSHIPRGKIRTFLDEQVARGEIDYVVIFSERGARWGDILPALDECRKSRVQIVLLNQYES